jgi:hypothetical protein
VTLLTSSRASPLPLPRPWRILSVTLAGKVGAECWVLGAGCWVMGWPWLVLFTPCPSLTVGTLKATNFKKRCLQATITQDNTYGQEDCLYLNIWVPQGRKQGMDPSFPENPTPPPPQNFKPWSRIHLVSSSSTALKSALRRGGGANC